MGLDLADKSPSLRASAAEDGDGAKRDRGDRLVGWLISYFVYAHIHLLRGFLSSPFLFDFFFQYILLTIVLSQ